MKRILVFVGSLFFCLSFSGVFAQVNNPGQVAKDATTNHANNDMNNAADRGLDKTEQSIGNLFKKKKNNKTAVAPAANTAAQPATAQDQQPSGAPSQSIKSYQNYDFVAGDKILFSDDFVGDQDGEFPAHWELVKGQAVVNQQQGAPAFILTDGNYAVVRPRITTKNYLGNEYTIEWDTYFEPDAYGTLLLFHLPDVTADYDGILSINKVEVTYNDQDADLSLSASLPATIADDNYVNKWHHIAVGFKNKQLKIYVDQYRVLVVPDCKVNFGSVSFAGSAAAETPIIFKNVKIADGGNQNMIGNLLTNGKFITHGITFDVDKAILKPESMGILNEVAKFMKANAAINMEIDGHTDNSGASAHNLTLSHQRADAVKAQLVAMGIDGARLSTQGFGDTKPIGDNSTPEGKANNRRVEFVKK